MLIIPRKALLYFSLPSRFSVSIPLTNPGKRINLNNTLNSCVTEIKIGINHVHPKNNPTTDMIVARVPPVSSINVLTNVGSHHKAAIHIIIPINNGPNINGIKS